MKESMFQRQVKEELKERFPGCIILKNDPSSLQGIPDLSIFYGQRWGMLEIKNDVDAPHQPNQDYYVEKLNEMSFAAFINPGNKERVLDEMERSLKV
mgnify:FL=1